MIDATVTLRRGKSRQDRQTRTDSDGIDECHYGKPETSVTPQIMVELWRETGNELEAYVRRLVELALSGVDRHPGGQDNVAVIAALA